MIISVGNLTRFKTHAIKKAFEFYFPDTDIHIIQVEVRTASLEESDESVFLSARYRARVAADAHPNFDYAVGIEEGVVLVGSERFITTWAYILNRTHQAGYASGNRTRVLKSISDVMDSEYAVSFGDAFDKVFPGFKVSYLDSLTRGFVSRGGEVCNAVSLALGYLTNN